MNGQARLTVAFTLAALALASFLVVPELAWTHCDTLDGPVVAAARVALDKGDVTPALKWVKREHEDEVRAAFQQALAVRVQGPEARELADRYFFETLVRLHREGEGEPYTGLKLAGSVVAPAILAADEALETGSVEELLELLVADLSDGVRERFRRAVQAKGSAEESVEQGREYVRAYVEFMHYAERLHALAAGGEAKGHGSAEPHERPSGG